MKCASAPGLLCRGMDVAAQRKTVSNESALALSVGSARWEEASAAEGGSSKTVLSSLSVQ